MEVFRVAAESVATNLAAEHHWWWALAVVVLIVIIVGIKEGW